MSKEENQQEGPFETVKRANEQLDKIKKINEKDELIKIAQDELDRLVKLARKAKREDNESLAEEYADQAQEQAKALKRLKN